jgi:hypothetical protein
MRLPRSFRKLRFSIDYLVSATTATAARAAGTG